MRDYYFDLCACLYVFTSRKTGSALGTSKRVSKRVFANVKHRDTPDTSRSIWNSHWTRSFSFDALTLLFVDRLLCVCVRVCWHWAPITRCTSHQRIVRIAWFPFPFSQLQLHCIGTLLTDTDPDVCAINFIFACCKSITTSRISSIVFDKTDEREAPTEFIGALCEINALDEELREWESEAKGRLVEFHVRWIAWILFCAFFNIR